MKARLIIAATVLAVPAFGAVGAFADSGASSPTTTHNNPSSCLGSERASRNSNGGDRAQGGFGQAQSDYVAQINSGDTAYSNYGDALQAFKATC